MADWRHPLHADLGTVTINQHHARDHDNDEHTTNYAPMATFDTHDNTFHTTDYTVNTVFNDHSARHEVAGADVINVLNLSGLLADPQTPVAHNNTYHSTNYAAAAITISAGGCLTGGGDLTANRTISHPTFSQFGTFFDVGNKRISYDANGHVTVTEIT